ncbi:MAG TPA: PilT/PilU family type 4a pilus ATPase [Terriglobales bacterium]|jgi:twitching motility protein PilT|nr:PilT/PilU family type 4a pilus ATPase [Terriglobales bacterium]
MAATGTSPIPITFEGASGSGRVATTALLAAMLKAHEQVSDLIFSPGRPPQVEVHGQLIAVQAPALHLLSADDTRHIAADLIGSNKQAITILREQGSCDISYGLPGVARFRVNVFIQRGSCAIVMRVIATSVPEFEALSLPPQLREVANLRHGIVLITGPRGSGKSSTLAALLDQINEQQNCHIITVEDPIEFLHTHKRATIHQRELHSDTPNAAMALRAALRQAPKVILLGEMHDRETMQLVLEAAETGHLVLSSLNTVDATKAIERIVSSFAVTEQQAIRGRLAKTFRYIVSQRLLPRQDGSGRIAAIEILKSNPRTRECVENGEGSSGDLFELMKDGFAEGMQTFDGEIEKLVRAGTVNLETALSHASNPRELQNSLKTLNKPISD